jgi:hypothetical protein
MYTSQVKDFKLLPSLNCAGTTKLATSAATTGLSSHWHESIIQYYFHFHTAVFYSTVLLLSTL